LFPGFSYHNPNSYRTIALYNLNKNRLAGGNGKRDYTLSLRPHDPDKGLEDTSDFENRPELAHARIRQFAGGYYKRFIVQGPLQLAVEIRRNGSLNAIVTGVFLDPIEEEPFPYFGLKGGVNSISGEISEEKASANIADAVSANIADAVTEAVAGGAEAENLWATLEKARRENLVGWLVNSRPFYTLQAQFYLS
jgi:hypothetical protein